MSSRRSRPRVVQKYGGTSVGSPARIKRVETYSAPVPSSTNE